MTKKEKIKNIITISSSLTEEFNQLLLFFNSLKDEIENPFDISKNIPSTNTSIANLFSNVVTIDGIIQKFDNSTEYKLVPDVRLTNLENSITAVSSSISSLTSHISSQSTANGGYKNFNYENFHATGKNNAALNFLGQFTSLNSNVESLLTHFFEALVILRPSKASYNFLAASNSLNKLIEQNQSEYSKISKTVGEIENMLEDVSSIKEKTNLAHQEIERLRLEGTNDRKTISDYAADSLEKVTNITTTSENAITLENQIIEYNEKFESFDRQLQDREIKSLNGQEKLNILLSKFDTQQKSIDEKIRRSEQMLKGATVAGLAGNFQEIKDSLTLELNSARRTFYVGIILLFISAIPLMLFVFLPVLAPFLKTSYPEIVDVAKTVGIQSTATGWQYLGQILARFIILLPAIWFVSFTAIRHSSLFRLREHYSYKYSMAVSVEGFKKEAKGYENEIAAMVLEQLAFNPADKLLPSKDIKEGRIPNPFMEYFFEKFKKNADQALEKE